MLTSFMEELGTFDRLNCYDEAQRAGIASINHSATLQSVAPRAVQTSSARAILDCLHCRFLQLLRSYASHHQTYVHTTYSVIPSYAL